MSYAPHTNTEYANGADVPLVLGSFVEVDFCNIFEYALREVVKGNWLGVEAPHLIYLTNGETRYARVLKTVAYVVIDENDNCEPVWAKWQIKKHRQYPTDWAVEQRVELKR